MDEFARAEERAMKRYRRDGVPDAIHLTPDGPIPVMEKLQEKVVVAQEPVRPVFNRLSVAISNGPETYIMDFQADDLLENMMHSDRTEDGIKAKLFEILRANLTSGIR